MSINRYEIKACERNWEPFAKEVPSDTGEYVHYEDHMKVVDSYLAEIAAAKAELATLMSSLETWDEEFK